MSLLIIDFDDTLVDTSSLFTEALDTFDTIMARLGHPGPQVRERLIAAQQKYVDGGGLQHGDHLAHLMVEVAQEIRYNPHIGFPVPGRSVGEILVAGRRPYAERAVPFSGVCEALHDLRDAGHTLVLYTKGDPETQARRAHRSGVVSYFHGLYITLKKDAATLLDVVRYGQSLAPDYESDVYVIGDSARGDILPAIESGIPAIRVGTTLWKHLDHVDLPEGAYTQVDTFVAAADLILGGGLKAPAPHAQEVA